MIIYQQLKNNFPSQAKVLHLQNPLSVIKSHSMTSLPIINKSKLIAIHKYFENLLKDKQLLEEQFNDNYPNFQHFFFDLSYKSSEERNSLNKQFKTIPNLLSAEFMSKAEIQKFVNEDLLPKKKEYIEREIKKIKSKKHFKSHISKRKTNKVDVILFEMFLSYLNKQETEKLIKLKKENKLKHLELLERILENKIQQIYKKPISYKSGSIIKSENRIALGQSRARLAFIPENKLFKVFYCLDYMEKDENEKIKKKFINIPMAYNPNYHTEFYLRSLGENKFNKGSQDISDEEYLAKMFKKEKLHDKLQSAQIIYVREHMISLTEKGRLKIGLSFKEKKEYKEIDITEDNTIGIDLGGSVKNALALSSKKFISMEYLYGICDKLNIADKIKNDNERNLRYRAISKEARFKMNEFISSFLNEMASLKISHIVMEKLDPWNVKWRDKDSDMKANRLFRILRSQGFSNLVRIQARNRGMILHTVPSYYTSQMCPICGHIARNNFKSDRVFCCEECGHTDDRDYNAARNLKSILLNHKRFLGSILKKDSVFIQEYIPKEFLKKELVYKAYGGMKKEAEELNSSGVTTQKSPTIKSSDF